MLSSTSFTTWLHGEWIICVIWVLAFILQEKSKTYSYVNWNTEETSGKHFSIFWHFQLKLLFQQFSYSLFKRGEGVMTSLAVCLTLDQAVQVWALDAAIAVTVSRSWERHSTLTVHLSIKVYMCEWYWEI